MIQNKPRRISVAGMIARDAAIAVAVLVVFALFHHALPRRSGAIASIVKQSELADTLNGGASPTVGNTPLQSGSAKLPAQSPNPEGAATGDFSASFPSYDTGADALYSYQGDMLRIAVNMVQENDVTYYVADVWVKNISLFRTAFAKGEFGTGIHEQPAAIASANNAVFAVTGDYCGARNSGVVIRNGDLYRDSVSSDVCVLYADGTMATYPEADFSMTEAADGAAWQAWGFGPSLLDANGKAITQFESSIKGKNPRSAVGYYAPGHYCFVTVDGRQEGYSVGMTLGELAGVFEGLGCSAAFNLDGGATAEMIFDGKIVNKPYKGGRASSDIICFSKGD